ncbi:MAG: hypothetical protein J7L44_02355 [Candidatus Diapherotrites archaeon]|nr:hypothetical protein [Candidatus Diapherotrites archaeon]
MPTIISILLNLILSICDLLKGALPFAIFFFLLALAGLKLRAYMQRRFKLSWIAGTLSSTFLFSLVFVCIAYAVPFFISLPASSLGVVPQPLLPEPAELLSFIVLAAFKIAAAALFLALFALPFILLGSYICSVVEKHKFNRYFALFVASYLTSALAFALLLYYLRWIFLGLFFFLYSF